MFTTYARHNEGRKLSFTTPTVTIYARLYRDATGAGMYPYDSAIPPKEPFYLRVLDFSTGVFVEKLRSPAYDPAVAPVATIADGQSGVWHNLTRDRKSVV